MQQYLDYLRNIMERGIDKTDRTGTGQRELIGQQMRFDLSGGQFPLLTTKKMHLKSIIHELIWFLKGDPSVKYLEDNGVTIWKEWTRADGTIGRGYGVQWRHWNDTRIVPMADVERYEARGFVEQGFAATLENGAVVAREIDQIKNVITRIKSNPDCRRLIVSAWNAAEIDDMALPACHAFFQFFVQEGKLSCVLTQRSADSFLGVPFNIASYALLTMIVAQVCDLQPGEFVWNGGSCHIYHNHFGQVEEQLSREPLNLPTMRINPDVKTIDDFKFEDFELVGYESHPTIKADVAV